MGDVFLGRRTASLVAVALMAVGFLGVAAGSARAADTQTLTVTTGGNGSGSISSSPGGIYGCWTSCSAEFATGSVVTLTVAPTTRSVFQGWSGECFRIGFSCEVSMDAAKTVQANLDSFAPDPGDEPELTLSISKPLATPSSVKRKRGQKGRFKVMVVNDGDRVLGPVRICARAPKKSLSLNVSCRELAGLGYGDEGTVVFGFKVRWKAKPGKKIMIRFAATAEDLEPTRSSATIKVR